MTDNQANDHDQTPPETDARPQGIRWRAAVIIVAVVAMLILALQFFPGEFLPQQFRNAISIMVSFVGTLALLIWLAVFSRIPARPRAKLLVVAVIVLLIPVAMIRRVEFTGDIVPNFVFRWDPTHLEILEAHRAETARRNESGGEETAVGEDLAANWTSFRGPDRSGICTTTSIRTDWETNPPELLWKQPIGGGYSQFVLSGNLAITIEQRGPEEAVVCYDARSGDERWVHSYECYFTESMGGDGPRASQTIEGDVVYSLGANGRLTCIDINNGEVKWHQDILKDGAAENLKWGMSGSPLLLGEVLVVNPGGPISATGDTLVAYDKATGDVVWGIGEEQAAYASPVVRTIDGVEQILVLEASEVVSYASDGSARLWSFPWETQSGINCSQPIIVTPNRVLITAGYTKGSALLEITRDNQGTWNAEPVWVKSSLRGKFSTPIAHAGHIFGLDEGVLVCIEAETGKRTWKKGRYGHGQMLLVDEVFFIQAEDGDIALVAADPEEYRELGRVPALEGRTWNTPALAAGRAYVRNHREMACFDLSPKAATSTLGLSSREN